MSTPDDVLGAITASTGDGDPYVRATDLARTLKHLTAQTVRNVAYDLVRSGALCTGVYKRGIFRGSPRRVFWLPEHDDALPDNIIRRPPPPPPGAPHPVLRTKPRPRYAPGHCDDILDVLHHHGPATATQLRERLILSGDITRANLDHLLATGKIRAVTTPTGKRGRPPTYYHLT